MNLYKNYRVVLQFRDRLCGGIPKSNDAIEGWMKVLREKHGIAKELEEKTKEEIGVDLEEKVEGMWTGFKSDEKGLYVEGRQIKAMLKESATVTGLTIATRGAGLKDFITQGVFVSPVKVYLDRMAPDETEITVAHIKAPQGRRSCFKKFDVVKDVKLEFIIRVLKRADNKEPLTEAALQVLLEHGQDSGFGSNRSQGYGTFDIEAFEEIPEEDSVDPWAFIKTLKKEGVGGKKGGKVKEATVAGEYEE